MSRREHILQQQSPLPSEYRQLEYIESTGTQYINTGCVCPIDFTISVDFAWTTIYGWNNDYHGFGLDDWINKTLIRIIETGNSVGHHYEYHNALYCDTTNVVTVTTTVPMDTNRHSWYLSNGLQQFDGVQVGATTRSNTSTYTFILFAMRANSGVSHYAKMRLYKCQITLNGNAVREYLPALRIADSKPGLYDTVNNQFYTNSGTGEFLYN